MGRSKQGRAEMTEAIGTSKLLFGKLAPFYSRAMIPATSSSRRSLAHSLAHPFTPSPRGGGYTVVEYGETGVMVVELPC